ncbi:MAG: hypothetical protein JSW26_07580 [Desulfobacterales bacterium]|nr:MAG: hypothetical protein JSW26_07580 [Desulfobacterales bacterium]
MAKLASIVEESEVQSLHRSKNCGVNMRCVFALLSLSAFLYCFGCSGANYGSIKHSRDVTQAFETYHVYPQHRYYYLNQENNPYAVVALQNGYTISDNRWMEFDPQTDKLEKVVELVKRFPVNYSNAYGSYLKDSMGNQIGYWYSSLPIRSLKVDSETKKVSIYTESPWLRDEERGFGTGGGVGIGVGSGGSGIGIRIGR